MTRFLFMFLAIALVASPAPDAEARSTNEARAAYKKGRAYYKKGKFIKAIGELEKAYRAKPHPALLRYIGDAYYKLNDAQKAIEYYGLYLKGAPKAADRGKIKSRVQKLEQIIGPDGDGRHGPGARGSARAAGRAHPPGHDSGPDPMAPTGEDSEVPAVLRGLNPGDRQAEQRDGGTSAMTVMKWISAGLAAGGLALGITFNRLAAGKASDLEEAVRKTGNEDGKSPKVPFGEEHFRLEQDYKRNQTISLVGFIAGGVAAGAAATLFFFDRNKPERRRSGRGKPAARRVTVAPALGGGLFGLNGQISF